MVELVECVTWTYKLARCTKTRNFISHISMSREVEQSALREVPEESKIHAARRET